MVLNLVLIIKQILYLFADNFVNSNFSLIDLGRDRKFAGGEGGLDY